MSYIQENAEIAVRQVLRKFGKFAQKKNTKGNVSLLNAQDFMDDGSVINLQVSINVEEGSALFDFTGRRALYDPVLGAGQPQSFDSGRPAPRTEGLCIIKFVCKMDATPSFGVTIISEVPSNPQLTLVTILHQ